MSKSDDSDRLRISFIIEAMLAPIENSIWSRVSSKAVMPVIMGIGTENWIRIIITSAIHRAWVDAVLDYVPWLKPLSWVGK